MHYVSIMYVTEAIIVSEEGSDLMHRNVGIRYRLNMTKANRKTHLSIYISLHRYLYFSQTSPHNVKA